MLKAEFTESFAIIMNEETGKLSFAKFTTFAPGIGYGIGASGGLSTTINLGVNNADQISGKSFNLGVHGGLIGSFSGEINFLQDRGGINDYYQVFGGPVGGTIGVGAGVGGGFYADYGYTIKNWELSVDEIEYYLQNLDEASLDYLNYIFNKSTELQHFTLRMQTPEFVKNMLKKPIIEVGTPEVVEFNPDK